jgi:hypothetical protein
MLQKYKFCTSLVLLQAKIFYPAVFLKFPDRIYATSAQNLSTAVAFYTGIRNRKFQHQVLLIILTVLFMFLCIFAVPYNFFL